jgi:hypothetical protein
MPGVFVVHSSQANYRKLFELMHGQDSRQLYRLLIVPWVEQNRAEREWLCAFASRTGNPFPPVAAEELWRLYALSRINEILLLGFQPGQAAADPPASGISLDEYQDFARSMGLTVFQTADFSPFCHEIVQLDQAQDEDQPIQLESTYWPCLLLGEMVFSRGGVRVSGGKRHARKEVAESSTLYWSYRRKNRPHQDLSHGWGGNSQWRTRFRRDYRVGKQYHYNVDGKHDLAAPSLLTADHDGLTREERIELLVHRCFVRTLKAHDDLWPYDDTLLMSSWPQ